MMENLTGVSDGYLPLTQVPPIIQIKIQVLNLKTLKTQILIEYLTLIKLSRATIIGLAYRGPGRATILPC
jgi:hypothetical protein